MFLALFSGSVLVLGCSYLCTTMCINYCIHRNEYNDDIDDTDDNSYYNIEDK